MRKSPCARAWLLSIWAILIVVSLVLVNQAQAETRKHARQNSSILSEVLTLDEVAHLLRVNPNDVAQLAREHRIPGRLIGGHWRFRRTAILDWLGRKDTVQPGTDQSPPVSQPEDSPKVTSPLEGATLREPSKSDVPKDTLPKSALLDITGRGPAGDATPGSGKEPEKIGEKREVPTAEEVSLRGQQVLLRPQQLTLELDFSYTRSEQAGITVVPIAGQPIIANSLGEQDLFIWQFIARYGLPYDLLFVASLPLIHDQRTITAAVPGTSITDETSDTRTETADLFLALRHTTVKEGVGYPEVILSLQTLIPTHKSSYGIGGGITLIKRVDPVALFANFNYLHVFSREFEDLTRLRNENIFTIDYGFAFSINESLAMSTSVLGTFTGQTKFDNVTLDSIERFFLRTSLTALLTERLFVEPFVSFSLNGNDIVTVGIDIPYTFDVAPYLPTMFR